MCVYLDYLCWGLSGLGAILCVCLVALNDWNIDETMYEEDKK